MNLLIISRDQAFIARLKRLYDHPDTTVMVIPGVDWLLDKKRVPKEPHLVLFDTTEAGEKWARNVFNLRQIFDSKVVVVDYPANLQRAVAAFNNHAVRYLSKTMRKTDAEIRATIRQALKAGLPPLPSKYVARG